MKRISLMLALFLTLSFGSALAQTDGICDLDHVDGLFAQDTIGLGTTVTLWIRVKNEDPATVGGSSNGFEIYGSSPAVTWTITGHGPNDKDEAALRGFDWDGLWSVQEFSVNGSGADTLGFGGYRMFGDGIPVGFDNLSAFDITIDIPLGIPAGEQLCIDSAYYPPTGTWKWAYGAYDQFPVWGGPYCYDLYDIPNLCPEFAVGSATSGGGDHCDLVVIDYAASDAEGDYIDWTVQSGVGSITGANTTAQYTYAPTLADVGASVGATLVVGDQFQAECNTLDLVLNFTNAAPAFTGGLNSSTAVGMGNTACAPTVSSEDVDCDPSSMSFTVTPTPVGVVTVVGDTLGNFDVCFATATGASPAGDGGVVYEVAITLDDGGADKASATGSVFFTVLTTEPYEVRIEKTHGSIQGMHEVVAVTLDKGSEKMGGFDFMIAYDASALTFQAAIPGDFHTECGWEYFNYRFGPNGNCGNACPSGMLEVIALAETNNGPNHPVPGCSDDTLFTLDFLVSNDRTLECMYAPIRFYWTNCTDNSIAYHPSDDTLAAVQGVSRYVYDFDWIGLIGDANIHDTLGGSGLFPGMYGLGMGTDFPTYTGVQTECLTQDDPTKPVPIAWVDFYNGGVDIVCADSIDARGDLNLNGTANEIADAVLFSNYFVQGLSVFNVPGAMQGQIAASDVNADGLTLSVADLVYLIRVIVGDANPYPKLGAVAASYAYENGTMSVDTKMGAAFVVVEGNVNPTLLADNMDMSYQFDGRNTRVLVSKIERGAGFDGDFLSFDGRVVSVEFATYDGAPVAQKNVPTSYSLAQNYPNPFNGMTKIAFGMPTAGDYTLSIYNVTGQKVADFSGTSEAGSVTVSWDAANQASGVYFYKLDTQNFTDTKKMVYLK